MKISTLAKKSLAASAIVGLAAFGTPAIAASLAGLTTAPQLTSLEPLTIVAGDWGGSPASGKQVWACPAQITGGSIAGQGALAQFGQGAGSGCTILAQSATDVLITLPADLKTAVSFTTPTLYTALASQFPHVIYLEVDLSLGVVWTDSLDYSQVQSGQGSSNDRGSDAEAETVVSYEGPLLASATGRNAVAETAGTLSFKGKRLNLVTGATIGGIAVTVTSVSKSALELTFDSLPAGKHDVVLTSKSGAKLTLRGFVTVN